jgi:hypothetical protein
MLRTVIIIGFVILFIVVSAWSYMPWWELAFRSDNSPVSWLTSALLFACSVLALQTNRQDTLPKSLSIWLSCSLFLLSLDEQFKFHEYWRYHCSDWISWCSRPVEGKVDWLGDLPMAIVAVIGTATLIILYRCIQSKVAQRLLIAAFLVAVVLAIGIHYGYASGILRAWDKRFEEVFESLSVALFMCAMLEISPTANSTTNQVQSPSSE